MLAGRCFLLITQLLVVGANLMGIAAGE